MEMSWRGKSRSRLAQRRAGRKNKGGFAPPLFEIVDELQRANVLCLPALLTFGYGELNCLAFFEAAISVALDGGEVHEDIFTILTGDKAEAFSGIEPLHSSLFHIAFIFLMLIFFDAGMKYRVFSRCREALAESNSSISNAVLEYHAL